MLMSGHRIAGRYRLTRPLAKGGMGTVWVAHDLQLARDVAIKIMVPEAFALPDLVVRFEREAKAAAQIQSAHVVQIFDHGVDGAPFIVMPLLEGEDLSARLRRVGRLSIDATARIAGDACKGLRRAHELGVVHRDLKPANIFLAQEDDGETVKVLDFGVAKVKSADAAMTNANDLLGTPHYMAPEQARKSDAPVDHRADLWSLGVIVFRALTGRLPYPGDNLLDVLIRVASLQPVPVPSSLAPDLGPEVDRFIAIALAHDPAARYQSAQAFREALTRLASPPAAEARVSSPSGWDLSAQIIDGGTIPLPPIALPPERLSPAPPAQRLSPAPPQPSARGSGAGQKTMPLPSPMTPAQAASAQAVMAAQAGAGAHRPADTAPLPQAIVAAEPTPAALAATAAAGSGSPRTQRAGMHVVVFAAAGASIVVLVLVLAVAFMRAPDSESGSVPPVASATPSAFASPPPASDRAPPGGSSGERAGAVPPPASAPILEAPPSGTPSSSAPPRTTASVSAKPSSSPKPTGPATSKPQSTRAEEIPY